MRNISIFIILLIAVGIESSLWGNPKGATVVSGEVQFDSSRAHHLEITAQDRAIISWDTFSIQSHETTKFILPSTSATVLNRVTSFSASEIAGLLQSNGQVYLINPHGVLITEQGVVDTAAFLASTLDFSDGVFLAGGDLLFDTTGKSSVVNRGKITAWDGDVILLGHHVESTGDIEADQGVVALGAGEKILLTSAKMERISIQVSYEERGTGVGITQEGRIRAVQAELKADGSLYGLAIQSSGVIQASGTRQEGGRICLVAVHGVVSEEGHLEAVGMQGTGGEIQLQGESVILGDHAFLDASGALGGGKVFVGGGFHGDAPEIMNAEHTYVSPSAQICAGGTTGFGHGGEVVVWSSNETYFYGMIGAQGGPLGGNGGSVEVSGLKVLDFRGQVNTLAPHGKTGSLLLDPTDITLNAVGPTTALFNIAPCGVNTYCGGALSSATILISDLLAQLLLSDVIVDSSQGTGVGTGGIIVADDILVPAASNNLTFNAAAQFTLNAGVTITNNSTSTIAINSSLTSSQSASILGNLTNGSSGNINVTSGVGISGSMNVLGTVSNTSSGNILLQAGTSAVNEGILVVSSTGVILNTGSGNVTIRGNSSLVFSVSLQGAITHSSSGSLNVFADIGYINTTVTNSMSFGAACGPVTFTAAGSAGATSLALAGTTTSASPSPINCTATLGGIDFQATAALTFSGAGNVTFSAPQGNINAISGSTLTFNAGGGNLTMNAGTAGMFAGTLTAGGTILFNSGAGRFITLNSEGAMTLGNITNNSSGASVFTATGGAGAITLSSARTLTWGSTGTAGSLTLNAATTITGTGAFNWGPGAAAGNLVMNAATSLTTTGLITFSALAGTSSPALSINAGTSLSLGALTYSSPFNCLLQNTNGIISNTGIFTFNVGAGSLLVNATAAVGNACNLQLGVIYHTSSPATITANTGNISTTGAGTFLFDGGAPFTIQTLGPAATITLGGTSMSFSGGAGSLTLASSGTCSLNGPIIYSYTGPFQCSSATGSILSNASGNLTFNSGAGDASLFALQNNVTLNAASTITCNSGAGSVTIQAGTAGMFNGSVSTGATTMNSGVGKSLQVTANGAILLGSITYNSTGDCQITATSGTITLRNASTLDWGSSAAAGSLFITGSGAIATNGPINISSISGSSPTAFAISGGGVIALAAPITYSSPLDWTIQTNPGIISLTSSVLLNAGSGQLLMNGSFPLGNAVDLRGTITNNGTSLCRLRATTGGVIIRDTAIISCLAGAPFTVETLSAGQSITVQDSSMTFSGGAGPLQILGANAVRIASTLSYSNSLPAVIQASSGALVISGPMTVSGGGGLSMSGGLSATLSGPIAYTATAPLTLASPGGTVTITGVVSMNTVAPLNITTAGGTDILIQNRVTNLSTGVIEVTAGRDLLIGSRHLIVNSQLGSAGGDLTFSVGRDVILTSSGTGVTTAYAQIGYDTGDINSNITFTTLGRNLQLFGGVAPGSYAVIGHGSQQAGATGGVRTGDITMNTIGGSVFVRAYKMSPDLGVNSSSFAQIGHLRSLTGTPVTASGNISLANIGGGLTLRGTNALDSYALIGHGGGGSAQSDSFSGNITVGATGVVRVASGTGVEAFAGIGHTAFLNGAGTVTLQADQISVQASNVVQLTSEIGTEAFLGMYVKAAAVGGVGVIQAITPMTLPHLSVQTTAGADIVLAASAPLTGFTGVVAGFLSYTGALPFSPAGNVGGVVEVVSGRDLLLEAGSGGNMGNSFAYILNGIGSPPTAAYDMTVTAARNLSIFAGSNDAAITSLTHAAISAGGVLSLESSDAGSAFLSTVADLDLTLGSLAMNSSEGGELSIIETVLGDVTISSGDVSLFLNSQISSGQALDMSIGGDLFLGSGCSCLSVNDYTIDVTGGGLLAASADVLISGGGAGSLSVGGNLSLIADADGSAQVVAANGVDVSSTAGGILLVGFPGKTCAIRSTSGSVEVAAGQDLALLSGSQLLLSGGMGDLLATAAGGTMTIDSSSGVFNYGMGQLTLTAAEMVLSRLSEVLLTGQGPLTCNVTNGDFTLDNGAKIQNFGVAGVVVNVSDSLVMNGGPLGETLLITGVGGGSISSGAIRMHGDSPDMPATISNQVGPLVVSATGSFSLDGNARILFTSGSGTFTVFAGTSLNLAKNSVLENQGSGFFSISAEDRLALSGGGSIRGNTGDMNLLVTGDIECLDASFVSSKGDLSIFAGGGIIFSSAYAQTTTGNFSVQAVVGDIDLLNGSSLKLLGGSGALSVVNNRGSLNLNNGGVIQNNGTGTLVANAGGSGVIRPGGSGESFISGKGALSCAIGGTLEIEASSTGRGYITSSGISTITAGVLSMTGFSSLYPALIQDTTGSLTVSARSVYLEDFSQIKMTGGAGLLTVNATEGDLRVANGSTLQNLGTGGVTGTIDNTLYIQGGPLASAFILTGNGDITLSAAQVSIGGFSSAYNGVVSSLRGSLSITSLGGINLNAHTQVALTSGTGTGGLTITAGQDFTAANDVLIQNGGSGATLIDVTGVSHFLAGAGNVVVQTATGGLSCISGERLYLGADVGGAVSLLSSGNIAINGAQEIFVVGSSGSINGAQIKTTGGGITLSSGGDLTLRDRGSISITGGSGSLVLNIAGDLNVENGSFIAHSSAGSLGGMISGNLFVRSGPAGSSYISDNQSLSFTIGGNLNIEASSGFQAYLACKGTTVLNAVEISLLGSSGAAPAKILNTTGNLTVTGTLFNLLNFGQILLTGGSGTLTVNATAANLRVSNGSMIAQQGTGILNCTVANTLLIEGGVGGSSSVSGGGGIGITASDLYMAGFSSTNTAQISAAQGALSISSLGLALLNPFAKVVLSLGSSPFTFTTMGDCILENGSTLQRGGSGTMGVNIGGALSLIGGIADTAVVGSSGGLNVAVVGNLRILSNIQGKSFITAAGNTSVSAGGDLILLGALEGSLPSYITTSSGTLTVNAADNLKLYDLGYIGINAGSGLLTVETTNGDCFLQNGSYIEQKGTGSLLATIQGNLAIKGGWSGASYMGAGGGINLVVGEDLAIEAVSGASAYLSAKGTSSVAANRLVMEGFSTTYTANITNTTGDLTVSADSLNLLNFSNIRVSGGSGVLEVDAIGGSCRIANGSFLQQQGSGALNSSIGKSLYLTGGAAGSGSILGGAGGVTLSAERILMGGTGSLYQGVISSTTGAIAVTTTQMLSMTPFSKIYLSSGPNNVGVNVGGTLYRADNTSITTGGSGSVNIVSGMTVICH